MWVFSKGVYMKPISFSHTTKNSRVSPSHDHGTLKTKRIQKDDVLSLYSCKKENKLALSMYQPTASHTNLCYNIIVLDKTYSSRIKKPGKFSPESMNALRNRQNRERTGTFKFQL